jgi:NAD(P)-dependent dehydrogenase (short-subunit alcohol dehydrogenase family)
MSQPSLRGSVAIVTGAGSGIGKATARALARDGAAVVVATLEDEGQAVANEIGGLFVQTDVTLEASVEAMVAHTLEWRGRVDILVNNAGITVYKPFLETTTEDWERIINTNLRGLYFCARAVGQVMERQRSGSIVVVSSNHALATLPDADLYAASKGGLDALARGLALSFGRFGVRVNTVCPGFTRVESTPTWLTAERETQINSWLATGRIASGDEIARIIAFLASDASSAITGATLVADGGLTARLYPPQAQRFKEHP